MKRTMHFLLPALALCAGWWVGSGASMPAATGAAIGPAGNHPTQANSPSLSSLKTMLSQLPALRSRPGNGHETEWVKWCLQIPDEDVPEAISQLDPSRDYHALRILYSRWAKMDFTSAWASFLKSPIPTQDFHFFLSALSDSHNGFGLGHRQLSEQPRSEIARCMLSSLKSVDPARAQQVIDSLQQDPSGRSQSGLQSYTVSWLKKGGDEGGVEDYAAALQQATGAKASEKFDDWIRKDASAALDWFRKLPPEKQATFDYHLLAWRLPLMPSADAMHFIFCTQAKELQDNSNIMEAAIGSADYYKDNSGQAHLDAAHTMRQWAVTDPQAALAYVQKLPANDLQSMLLGQVAGQLAMTDSAQAIDLINQHPGNQSLSMKGLVTGWASEQPAACWEWLNKISDAETLDSCLGIAVQAWGRTEPEFAVKALGEIKDPDTIKGALDNIEKRLAWNPAELQRIQALAPQLPWKQALNGSRG